MLPSFRTLLAASLVAAAIPAAASAATAQPGVKSIQVAINETPDGGTVVIKPGFYSEFVLANRPVVLAAEPGAVLVNPAGDPQPTLTFSGNAGATVTGLTVVSTVGDAVQVGGGATLIQRSQLFTVAEGASALLAASGSNATAKTVTLDSTVLSGPFALSARTTGTATVAPGKITVAGRHATAIGGVNATAESSAPGSAGIDVSFTDSLIRGKFTAVPGRSGELVGPTPATITADGARNSVADTAADAAQLFIKPSGLNFHLRADASVINKGRVTEGESATDIDGDARGPVTDYGADEFVNTAPIAVITGPAGALRQGRAVTFDASKSSDPEAAIGGGGVAAYHWEFGDGTSADTTTPTTTHTFTERKQFSVTVSVTDRQGLAGAPSAPVTVSVLDGTPPTVTIGQPAFKQRLSLYQRNRPERRARVTFFGNAADDTALATVHLALRTVMSKNGQCRWFNGRAKLVAAPCAQPVLLTATIAGGSWRYRLPLRARLPRGAYRLIAVAVDSSGLPGEAKSVKFWFR